MKITNSKSLKGIAKEYADAANKLHKHESNQPYCECDAEAINTGVFCDDCRPYWLKHDVLTKEVQRYKLTTLNTCSVCNGSMDNEHTLNDHLDNLYCESCRK